MPSADIDPTVANLPYSGVAFKTSHNAYYADKPPLSIRLGQKMFYQPLAMTLPDAYTFAAERMACNMDSEDARDGIDAFIQKRKPVWKGR